MAATVRLDPSDVAPPVVGPARPADADGDVTVLGMQRRARRCPACQQAFSGEARFCPFDGDALVDAPDWSPIADPLIGTIIDGRYEVTGVIGEGGMGTVYEVRHTTLGRRFAVKVLRRDLADPSQASVPGRGPELSARFIQEAKAAAAIGHPNIVAVTDFGTLPVEDGGSVPYFVMEHLTGTSLSDLLRAVGSLSPARAAGVVLQCAQGLAAAHAAGVIHRDLKPDNVFLLRGAERGYVKLLDFGVAAKVVGTGRLTKAGMVFGTPHYMSPEQAQGHAVDHRADIYALGVILYECLAGRVPFEADTYMGVLTKHMFAQPEPIEQIVTDRAQLGALGPVVSRCLEKDPVERYASMAELVAALELYLRDPGHAAAASLGAPARAGEALKLREAEAIAGPGRMSMPELPVANRAWLAGVAFAAVAIAALAFVSVRLTRAPRGSTSATRSSASASAGAVATPAPDAPRASASAAAAVPAAATSTPSASTPEVAAPRPRRAPRPAAAKPPEKRGDVVDPWAR